MYVQQKVPVSINRFNNLAIEAISRFSQKFVHYTVLLLHFTHQLLPRSTCNSAEDANSHHVGQIPQAQGGDPYPVFRTVIKK
jgi:hypothetical protein